MSKTSQNHATSLTLDWGKTISERKVNIFGDVCHLPNGFEAGELLVRHVSEVACTNSKFKGDVNSLGFTGYGTYIYPHGVRYEANFKDGDFHGEGSLFYPKGQELRGMWVNGKLTSSVLLTSDRLEYTRNMPYLQIPDRTYRTEVAEDDTLHIQLPKVDLSDSLDRDDIPLGTYHTGDGYYQSSTKLVYNFSGRPMKIATKKEENIIQTHFRQRADKPVGYHPELYEFWTSGRDAEYRTIVDAIKTQKVVVNTLNISYID